MAGIVPPGLLALQPAPIMEMLPAQIALDASQNIVIFYKRRRNYILQLLLYASLDNFKTKDNLRMKYYQYSYK